MKKILQYISYWFTLLTLFSIVFGGFFHEWTEVTTSNWSIIFAIGTVIILFLDYKKNVKIRKNILIIK